LGPRTGLDDAVFVPEASAEVAPHVVVGLDDEDDVRPGGGAGQDGEVDPGVVGGFFFELRPEGYAGAEAACVVLHGGVPVCEEGRGSRSAAKMRHSPAGALVRMLPAVPHTVRAPFVRRSATSVACPILWRRRAFGRSGGTDRVFVRCAHCGTLTVARS